MRRPISSVDLDDSLKKLVQKTKDIEKEYQETNQRFWTIMFIDVSTSAQEIRKQQEDAIQDIFARYQQRVRACLEQNKACFIEPGGGPQVVCCFEDPESCLLAAQAVLRVMEEWNSEPPASFPLLPAIGIHQGYINFHDGTIHQSNTNNKTKRIQTEAGPGEVFVSREIQEALEQNPGFSFQHIGSFSLKNIPEPQDIFAVHYRVLADFDAFSVLTPEAQSSTSKNSPSIQETYRWIFVYIDVCESTKKFWNYGDREASRLIKEYQKLCHTTFTQCGCAWVKSCEGDQIIGFFEIEDANSAVVSAIKILKDLFRRNVNVRENKQIRAAIGIHWGEVILEGDDPVTTEDMQRGKSIQSQAHADEILLSNQVTQLLDYQLREYITEYGPHSGESFGEMNGIDNLNWARAQLRPSLLHPARRKSPFHPRSAKNPSRS